MFLVALFRRDRALTERLRNVRHLERENGDGAGK